MVNEHTVHWKCLRARAGSRAYSYHCCYHSQTKNPYFSADDNNLRAARIDRETPCRFSYAPGKK